MTERPGLPAASALVLAGGRSTRFGEDKLRQPVRGVALLEHAVRAVADVTREVLLLGRRDEDDGDLVDLDVAASVRLVPDRDAFAGPLVAVADGLELAREPLVVVIAGDMPSLVPDVLAALLRSLDADEGVAAVCLLYRSVRQPLPAALRVGAATPVARRLVEGGERRLGALLEALPTRALAESEWRPLDPGAETLRDVDRPGDLPG